MEIHASLSQPSLPPDMPRSLIGDPLGQQVFASLRQFNAPPSYSPELSPDAQARLDRAYAMLASPLTPEAIDNSLPDTITAPTPSMSAVDRLLDETVVIVEPESTQQI